MAGPTASLAAELFVEQDPAAVMGHPAMGAAVVEVVAEVLAATAVVDVLDPHPLIVAVAVARAVDD